MEQTSCHFKYCLAVAEHHRVKVTTKSFLFVFLYYFSRFQCNAQIKKCTCVHLICGITQKIKCFLRIKLYVFTVQIKSA